MSVLQARARHNALKRYRSDDDPAVVEAKQELAVAGLADHIARIVNDAPPLSAERRSRLALLLTGGGLDGAA